MYAVFDQGSTIGGLSTCIPIDLIKFSFTNLSYCIKREVVSEPRDLEQKAKDEVSDEKLRQSTLIVTSIEDRIKPLEEYFKAGYTRLYPHSTSPDEIKFIQDFCVNVLPYFNESTSPNR